MRATVGCIASDLDRTLTGGDLVLDPAALERIRELRRRGLRVVVATGRRFDDPRVEALLSELDAVVAENGAVVHHAEDGALVVMHADFAERARAALGPLADRFAWGHVVGSGPRELSGDASALLAARKVEHAVEYNVDEVMLLPPGVDKATGAAACVARWGLRSADVWAIGDGENDVALLRWAGVGAAPANASPSAQAAADLHMASSHSQAFLDLTLPLVLAKPRPTSDQAARLSERTAAP